MTPGTQTAAPVPLPPAAFDPSLIEALSVARGEPDWLRAERLARAGRYLATPWPTGSEEEWRRTPLTDLPIDAPLDETAATEVSGLDPDAAARGVVFAPLAEAVATHPELVRPHLTDTTPGPATHATFWELARAAWTTGTFLYVPPRVTVELVLRARTVQSRAGAATFPRTLVVVGEDSQVTLLEEFASPDGGAGWFGGTVEVRAERGSRVRYASL